MNSPDHIEESLINVLSKKLNLEKDQGYMVDEQKYKIVFRLEEVTFNDNEEPLTIFIQVRIKIMQVNDNQVAVEFQKLSGDATMFRNIYNKLIQLDELSPLIDSDITTEF